MKNIFSSKTSLFVLSFLYLNVSLAGTCKMIGATSTEQKANYGQCLAASIAEYGKTGKATVAIYSATDSKPQDGALLEGFISVTKAKKLETGPAQWRTEESGCFATARYRGLLKGTFASYYGKILNSSGSTVNECLKSSLNSYVQQIAQGESLRTVESTFLLKDQIRVSTEIRTDLQDATFIREVFTEELK